MWVAAGGGFPLPGGGEEEDVISGGINQSTPGQFRGWGGEASSGGGGEREGGKGKGEGKLRYETMENLAKGAASLLYPRCLSFRFRVSEDCYVSVHSSLLLHPPTLSLSSPVRKKRGRAAPRRGSQMNRFNEKMASQPRVGTRAGYTPLPPLPVEPLRGGEERLLWLAHQKPLHESRLK